MVASGAGVYWVADGRQASTLGLPDFRAVVLRGRTKSQAGQERQQMPIKIFCSASFCFAGCGDNAERTGALHPGRTAAVCGPANGQVASKA